jgi:mono/diheme cytochrome c family protein
MKKLPKKIGRWLGYALLALLGLALTAYGYATWNVSQRLNKVYPTQVPGIPIPTDSAAVARGAHLYVVHACRDCHGATGAAG